MNIILTDDTDTINIADQDNTPVVTLFFHRLQGRVSNTTVILHAGATFQDVTPTVIYEAPTKPVLVKRT